MSYEDDLPRFGDTFRQYYNPDLEVIEIRRKSHTRGNLSVAEGMDLIGKFMKMHQMTYVPNKNSNSLLLFPFMFNTPKEGDIIINSRTDEKYTIEQIIVNPSTGRWQGLVKIDMPSVPSPEKRDILYFDKDDNYLEYNHIYPTKIANLIGANTEDIMKNIPQIKPSVTWNLVKMEPGGLSKAFDSRKEYKPRVREYVKDPLVPGYTVEIRGKVIDSIVQFDCWSNDQRTSEKLVSWFENFLNSHMCYIRQCGIVDGFFWQRPEESLVSSWRQSFAVRGTQYYFRTEELEASYEKDLVKIDIVLGSEERIDKRMFREHRYIAGQLVTGELTYDQYKALFYNSGQFQFGEIDFLQ